MTGTPRVMESLTVRETIHVRTAGSPRLNVRRERVSLRQLRLVTDMHAISADGVHICHEPPARRLAARRG